LGIKPKPFWAIACSLMRAAGPSAHALAYARSLQLLLRRRIRKIGVHPDLHHKNGDFGYLEAEFLLCEHDRLPPFAGGGCEMSSLIVHCLHDGIRPSTAIYCAARVGWETSRRIRGKNAKKRTSWAYSSFSNGFCNGRNNTFCECARPASRCRTQRKMDAI
jgi:hypothetical protein